MEEVIKAVCVSAIELRQVHIGVAILSCRLFLGLMELILGSWDLFFFVLKDLSQHLRLLFQLTSDLLQQS